MRSYCESIRENVFDMVPVTFYVEVHDFYNNYGAAIQPFYQYFKSLEQHKTQYNAMKAKLIEEMVRVSSDTKVPLLKCD